MKFDTKDVFVVTIHKSKSKRFVGCVAFTQEPTQAMIDKALKEHALPPVAIDISITQTHLFTRID